MGLESSRFEILVFQVWDYEFQVWDYRVSGLGLESSRFGIIEFQVWDKKVLGLGLESSRFRILVF